MLSTRRTKLYLIRHAETVTNTTPHLVGGRSNESPLTELGVEQAIDLGYAMLAKNIWPKKVYNSPALRCKDTARKSLDIMGLTALEPIIADEIQELSQGIAEGQPRDEVYTDAVLQAIDEQGLDFKLEGGESMREVGLRMHTWVMDTFANQEPGTYFVHTHGGSIKNLAGYILGWEHDQIYNTVIDNTSVNLFTLDRSLCQVEYLNRSPHLV